jgi:hypothetical protein
MANVILVVLHWNPANSLATEVEKKMGIKISKEWAKNEVSYFGESR